MNRAEQGRSWIMAKRKKRVMSEKDVLKHYTAYDNDPLSAAPGTDARKMLDQIRASKPDFIKAVLTVDPLLTGRKSAVIRVPATKSRKGRKRKHGKAKDE
jgi:hypothetical protein